MLIYAVPAIIWLIMRLMKTIMLTWPNAFNAWMCVIVTFTISYLTFNWLWTMIAGQ